MDQFHVCYHSPNDDRLDQRFGDLRAEDPEATGLRGNETG